MKTLPTCLCIFGLAGAATAGAGVALMDQIGPDDGAEIDTSNILANQFFEASFSAYDIAAIDDFDNASGMAAAGVQGVVGGWNGYTGVDGISGLNAEFYPSYEAAGISLTGYVSLSVPGTPVADPNWTFDGYELVGVAGTMPIAPGINWVALIPNNEFGVNGQTGAAISFIGDNNSYQCNPNGGFGFGAYQLMPNNIALRVMGGSSDPCDIPLNAACNTDITGPNGVPDGLTNVDDVLGVIGSFGEVGDGTSRPMGDCYPLPTGNCEVNVDDLLEVIGAFGGDCLPVGACCFGLDGCADDVKEADCTGEWLGAGSSCAECVSGACCNSDGTCDYLYSEDCTGAFQGADVLCADVVCAVAPDNDICDNALSISDGDTGVDNTSAYSDGPVDFNLCDNFDVEDVFNDIWFVYEASCDGDVTISTCDTVDFDSRLAVYGSCGGAMIACNDDCGGANNTLSSELAVPASAGDMLYIRLGSFAEGGTGTGVLSVSCVAPMPGACCLGNDDCLGDLMPVDCAAFGGEYMGSGTDCATVECGAGESDNCEGAVEFVEGANPFATTDATDSGFGEPDDTQCDGTFLDWMGSPDVWGHYMVPGDGTITVSLCDAASYDTSLVLYEGPDCASLTQVACNGDSTVETGCQSYYSGVYDMPVTGGSTIYIRLGGWQGATGPGTCTITFTGAGATGACCLSGDCLGEMTSSDCAGFGGTWYAGVLCADVDCPENVDCNTGNGASPTAVDGAWTAGTSDGGSGYLRAADVSAPSVADVTVYGLSLVYSGGWGECTDASGMGMSMDLMDSSYGPLLTSIPASYTATNLVYAGVYALHGWTAAPGYSGSVGAVSCLFAAVRAKASVGSSGCRLMQELLRLDDGTGWIAEAFGVNYCITE